MTITDRYFYYRIIVQVKLENIFFYTNMALQRTTHRFKLVMLGDSTVGKTALITRFVQNHFTELMPATIGAHFQKQTFIMEDKIITLDGR